MISKVRDELIINKKYLTLSLIISLYVFLPLFYISTKREIIAVFLSILILFTISKVSKIIFIFLSAITLFIDSILLHIVHLWGIDSLEARIEVASLSPKSESFEYLETYLGLFDILILFYILIGIFLFYKLAIHLKNYYTIVKGLSLSFLIFILSIFFYMGRIHNIRPYTYIEKYINISGFEKIQQRNFYINNLDYNISNFNLDYDKIVIVMGESVNKNHMSAYNYNIKTTPFLDSLLLDTKSFKYNVIAPTNQTRYSVPIDLTNATIHNFNLFYKTKSIITTFKEYGYKTYWLSNQGKIGIHENAITTISNEADYIKIENMLYMDAKYDSVLIKYLDQIKINNSSKELYFIHLMGSHFNYEKRYPIGDALFKKPKNIIEKYDNTIFYTDKILSKIYNKFKNSRLLFIYLSDHGEIVDINIHSHGFIPTYKDEYEIPLIVYSNLKNERLNRLKLLNKKSYFNMESFCNFIEYTVGIDQNISNISTNSDVFTVKPENIRDYNKLKYFETKVKLDKHN